MSFRIGLKFRGVKHGEPWLEVSQLFGLGTDEHVVDEDGAPCARRHEPDRNAPERIGAGKHVHHVQLLVAEVGDYVCL